MAYKLFQAIIKDYTSPRECTVTQIPEYYPITNVRLPRLLSVQYKPLKGSIVMVAMEDSFKSFILCVLREPLDFITKQGQLRGSAPLETQQLQAGEVFLESRGDPTAPIPGFGSTLFLGNDGTVSIHSGKRKEYLVIGGTDTDDDEEVVLHGTNGFFESTINPVTQTQSSFRFDSENTVQVINTRVTVPTSGVALEVPVGQLTITTSGQISLKNTLGSIDIAPSGSINVVAPSVNFNNGTFGAARLNDSITLDPSTDPAYWQFWLLHTQTLTAMPVATDPGSTTALANALRAELLLLCSTIPQTMTGRVSSASSSVTIGS